MNECSHTWKTTNRRKTNTKIIKQASARQEHRVKRMKEKRAATSPRGWMQVSIECQLAHFHQFWLSSCSLRYYLFTLVSLLATYAHTHIHTHTERDMYQNTHTQVVKQAGVIQVILSSSSGKGGPEKKVIQGLKRKLLPG